MLLTGMEVFLKVWCGHSVRPATEAPVTHPPLPVMSACHRNATDAFLQLSRSAVGKLFHKELDSKYFTLCGPWDLCCNDSTLL